MVKSRDETIQRFNAQINMTPQELKSWLASEQSHKVGVGNGSGGKIVAILERNPENPTTYDEVRGLSRVDWRPSSRAHLSPGGLGKSRRVRCHLLTFFRSHEQSLDITAVT